MPIPAALAGSLAGQGSQIAETAVNGIGTLLGGLDAIINPQEVIPPFIGMTSSDFMNMGLAAIMASANTNLQFAKNQAVSKGYADDLAEDIANAELIRQQCAIKFGAKAQAGINNVVGTKPTRQDVENFYFTCRRLIGIQNTQQAQLKLYKEYSEKAGTDGANFDFKGLLRKIVKGVGKVFTFTDRAKTVYEKAKPYLEKI